MKSILKDLVISIELVEEMVFDIEKNGDGFVLFGGFGRLDLNDNHNDNIYKLDGDKVIKKPHIKLLMYPADANSVGCYIRDNTTEQEKSYENILDATVTYAKATEQLNNPNIKYIQL